MKPLPSREAASASEDFSVYNFTVAGTWTEEKGYGYTFTIQSEIFHVNYDKNAGRHYFYYTPKATIGGEEKTGSQTKMEAKDSAYRKTLAADYKIYEERNAVYMFCGGQEGGSGNLSTAWIYLLPESKLASMSGTSNCISYNNVGSWSEDKANHVITMDINGTAVVTNAYCDTPGKEGYRCSYAPASSNPGGSSSAITMYASCDTSKCTWDQYTTEDFEGTVAKTLQGSGDYADHSLELTTKGYANVKQSGKTKIAMTYTTDASGNITVKNGEEAFVSTQVGGKLHITITWTFKSGSGPFAKTETATAEFVEA